MRSLHWVGLLMLGGTGLWAWLLYRRGLAHLAAAREQIESEIRALDARRGR